MGEKILFSLENCIKCTQTKELMNNRNDIEILTYPHDINEWEKDQLEKAKSYDVLEDLKKTAPILVINNEKKIGYLRIRKWLQDNHE
jgi:hypothetical protein